MKNTTDIINVLVVDDVPQNLIAINALLERPGLNIIQARSGHEALEVLLVEEVALALIDVQMPHMDGFELAELMRGSERTRTVPLIFLTAGAREKNTWFRGYEAGAVDFLYKPIDETILRSKVNVFVDLFSKERQLSRQLDELKSALALNELFVAVLGHDLRNPLSAVLNGAELMARVSADPVVASTAARIKSSGLRMTGMVEQLLDVARIRAGGMELRRERTNVDLLCRTIIDELAAAHGHANVQVSCAGNTHVDADPGRMAQVLSNLVSNALQHGAPRQPVEVDVDGTSPDALHIRIRNGGAIPCDALPTIFQPFLSRQSMNGPQQGLGLGLYIVKMFVEGHGGTVSVAASEGLTTFTVSLPRSAAQQEGPSLRGGPQPLAVQAE
ncbi:response regulator [Pseudoduganella sp. GCM10020061]|uniref:hybrid sensor histidine kinase/response regulator n=1 Tax=Pseudoduganella sp. GCM10020061 TaxID=3317345 RepID=UPI00362E98AA